LSRSDLGRRGERREAVRPKGAEAERRDVVVMVAAAIGLKRKTVRESSLGEIL
jgi:hypothetical protein